MCTEPLKRQLGPWTSLRARLSEPVLVFERVTPQTALLEMLEALPRSSSERPSRLGVEVKFRDYYVDIAGSHTRG